MKTYECEGIIRGGSNYSIEAIFREKTGRIVLHERTWDGIDRPDHTDVCWMNSNYATGLIEQLQKAIILCRAAEKDKAEDKKKRLEDLIKQKQSELDSLKKELK